MTSSSRSCASPPVLLVDADLLMKFNYNKAYSAPVAFCLGLGSADGSCLWPVRVIAKNRSQSSTSATTLPSCGIGRDRSDILNSSDLESVSGESSDGRLGTGAGGLDTDTTSSSEFDVDGVDSDNGEGLADVNGGEHS